MDMADAEDVAHLIAESVGAEGLDDPRKEVEAVRAQRGVPAAADVRDEIPAPREPTRGNLNRRAEPPPRQPAVGPAPPADLGKAPGPGPRQDAGAGGVVDMAGLAGTAPSPRELEVDASIDATAEVESFTDAPAETVDSSRLPVASKVNNKSSLATRNSQPGTNDLRRRLDALTV